jgi:hypothetical protein
MAKHEPVEEIDKKSTLNPNENSKNNKVEPMEIRKDKIIKGESMLSNP